MTRAAPLADAAIGHPIATRVFRGAYRHLAAALVLLLGGLIEAFHLVISPWLGATCGWGCRFEPSCSQYARQALRTHGLLRGGWRAAYRLLRCNPFGGHGYDPVGHEPTP